MGRYKDEIYIDKNSLDVEWETHPAKVEKWGDRLADAQDLREELRDKLELKYAKLSSKIRSNPEDYGLKDKPTEGAINNIVIKDKEYLTMRKEVRDAESEVNHLSVVMKALDHRKRALEKLTDLFFSGYWAEPRERKGEMNKESIMKAKQRESIEDFDRALKRRR